MNAQKITNGYADAQEPVQVVQAFLAAHHIDQIQLALLAALQAYALNEKKGFLEIDVTEQDLAALFDDLVSLVAALQDLSVQPKIVVSADNTA